MKRGLVWTVVIAASLVLWALASGFLFVVRPILHGDPAGADPVRIEVPAGTSLAGIADRLRAAGVVRHPTVFRRFATLAHFDRQIRSGEYDFVAGESYRRILERLREGDIVQIKVTLPEGLTCREIAGVLARKLGIKQEEFLLATQDTELRHRHNIESPSLEGYLYPDTYFFPSKTTAQQAIETMLQRFFTVWTPRMEERARAIGMTRGQVLALASIIENEALLDSERPRISAVYHNRLQASMLLQADPTVLYALGGVHRRVLYRDLRVASPYNTYLNPGLPPGPICNPGRISIEAALAPQQNCGELFFVAAQDGTGRHVFTRTLAEHLAAKRRAEFLLEQRSAEAAAATAASAGGTPEETTPPAPRATAPAAAAPDTSHKP